MPLSFLAELASGIGDPAELVRAGLAGWRYLFSKSFREQTHFRWERSSAIRVAGRLDCPRYRSVPGRETFIT